MTAVTNDPMQWLWAGAVLFAFLLICIFSLRGRKPEAGAADYLVLYASQTGQAEDIARRSAARFNAGGRSAQCLSLGLVTADILLRARYILCVASTTGEGDAPDEARRFERALMSTSIDLRTRSFAVLALGDRNYEHFCAFGQRLYGWLERSGARALAPCLTADDLDAGTLERWNDILGGLGAGSDAAGADHFTPWHIEDRELLNPLGDTPLYRVRLAPVSGPLPTWQAGDLTEILTEDGHRRDYSIASLPQEGHVELLVRGGHRPGGGSDLLTQITPQGGKVSLRLKTHSGFHAPEGSGPILMIAAGSGLAGLRPHILAQKGRRPVWLIYGERHPERDCALCGQLRAWRNDGTLTDLDLVFSQPDSGPGRYVQDALAARKNDAQAKLRLGGAIMVCGGLAMGRAVEATLSDIMGAAWIETALAGGRYRHDLY